jgi:LysM repeat protein
LSRPSRPTGRRRRLPKRTLGALLALAAVTTAHAPSVITVRPGDTLWDLARAHGTSTAQLRALNGLDAAGTIYAGRTLKISGGAGAGASAAPARAGSHVVSAGETLSHLAVRYGTTSRAIATANGLASSGMIRIGQRLTIPGRTSAGGSTPTHNAGVAIPTAVRSSVSRNRAALAARPQPSKAQVRDIVAATARQHGVPASLALAVAYHESGFQQRVVSPVDAIGVMQVLPSTGRGLSRSVGRDLDLMDVRDNVTAGVVLLKQLLRSTGSTDAALAGYYQGLGSVAKKGRLPQTHAYIRNVNALRARFGG